MIDSILHIGDIRLAFDKWEKFISLYQDIGFIKRDAIFICFCTQTLLDFDDVAQIADNIKRNSTQLKEIDIKDSPNWKYTTWFLYGLSCKYDSFCMMFTNNTKTDQVRGAKENLKFDFILE